jgi:phage baseplate assembly protein W
MNADSRAALADTLRAIERSRTQALVQRDIAVLQQLHAPEYQLITPAGRVFTRKRYLAAIEAEPFYAGWDAGEMDVRVSAQMAVLRYEARLAFPSGNTVHCWHTDHYELRGAQWQAVWSQATEFRAPPLAPA